MPNQVLNGNLKRTISEEIHATNPANMPPVLADYWVPVLVGNSPVFYADDSFTISGTATNATSATILTTDSVKDTYITSVSLAMIKDATSTSVLSAVTCVIDGATRTLTAIPGITLTIQAQTVNVSFPVPIKVDRSSIIAVTNSTATANVLATGSVGGFLRRRS